MGSSWLETMRVAWPDDTHVHSARSIEAVEGDNTGVCTGPDVARDVLVDVAEVLNGVVVFRQVRRVEMVVARLVVCAIQRHLTGRLRRVDVTGNAFSRVAQMVCGVVAL